MAGHVTAGQRFTNDRRCPICGGSSADVRGKRRRCIGYVSADRAFVHCSREEHAGGIERSEASGTYAHRAAGDCPCGAVHSTETTWRCRIGGSLVEIECAYDYRDERGQLLFQALRLDPKDFRQRRPDGIGGWIWNLQDVRRVPYRLPELIAANPLAPVYIVEGEKDVETLRSHGLVATCNPMGAKKWAAIDEVARAALLGRHVVIIADADIDGRVHARQVAEHVGEYAASVRSFEMPGAKDASDWFAAGGTVEQLEYIRAAIKPEPTHGAGGSGSGSALANGTHSGNGHAGHVDTAAVTAAQTPTAKKKLGRTWDDCADEIHARRAEPWISIRIGATDIAECRNGSFVPLIAPSGAGKSSLAIQMLVDHVLHRGPAVYLTYELDGDEAIGRAIGQLVDHGWANVLRGEIERGDVPSTKTMPGLARLRVLERDEATLDNLAAVVRALRAEYPGQPILVVVDYMQAKPAPPGKERGYTANVSAEMRRAAKTNRVVIIGISQASTDNSKKLRSGDLLGIEGSATGAETAQIERDAYVILTLGDRQHVDQDVVSWKLSVAKNRMGDPDIVHELHYRGRVGLWEVVGDPRKASDIRAEKAAERKKAKKTGGVDPVEAMFKLLVTQHAAGKRDRCTKTNLRSLAGLSKDAVTFALETLVDDGRARVVEVDRLEGTKLKKRAIYEPIQGAGQ
jgi:5S rRNA maturation endonuclease (ribonuclease M5)/KaiC/GvpD/RAD55 family RecA-like ATPase